MDKLAELQGAIDVLKGTDIEAVKKALALIGEPVTEGAKRKNTYEGGSAIKICVLQRGWVFIGRFAQDGQTCTLTDAHCIRYWGTTKGLGELATNGPTTKTQLDKSPDVTFHELTAVLIMDVKDDVWTGKL